MDNLHHIFRDFPKVREIYTINRKLWCTVFRYGKFRDQCKAQRKFSIPIFRDNFQCDLYTHMHALPYSSAHRHSYSLMATRSIVHSLAPAASTQSNASLSIASNWKFKCKYFRSRRRWCDNQTIGSLSKAAGGIRSISSVDVERYRRSHLRWPNRKLRNWQRNELAGDKQELQPFDWLESIELSAERVRNPKRKVSTNGASVGAI